jgi:glycosyltransferase involved in cell wall biosynthesis
MYADQLARRGHDVTVLHGWMPRLRDRLAQRLLGRRQDIPVGPNVRLLLASSTDYDRIGESLPDADVLVATWWHTVEACASAPPSKGRKFHLVQDHEIFSYLPERSAAVYQLPFRKIVVSNWLRELMHDRYDSKNPALVLNPVELDRFEWRKRQRSSPPAVGTLYAEAPRKNCEMALDAVKIARQTIPDLRLNCFSSEPLPKHWTDQPFVDLQYRPPQDRIPEIYRASDYWLFTSESEGFGLPILEAMAVGTPVIATRAGAAPDLVSEQTGALVDLDAAAMADAIVRLYAQPEKSWQAMSAACRAVAERHDVETAVSEFETALAGA